MVAIASSCTGWSDGWYCSRSGGGGGRSAGPDAQQQPWQLGPAMVCEVVGLPAAGLPGPEAQLFVDQAVIAVRIGQSCHMQYMHGTPACALCRGRSFPGERESHMVPVEGRRSERRFSAGRSCRAGARQCA